MYLSRPAVEVVSDVVDAALQLSDALHDRLELGHTQPRSKEGCIMLCDYASIAQVQQNVVGRANG